MQARSSRDARFSLNTERLGPLPLINHFLERMGLAALLEKHIPTVDKRCRVPHAQALGVLVRSIVVEREPIYRAQETVHGFAAGLFGVAGEDIESLSDDRLGRALDRLFEADRAALLTEVVLAVAKRFAVQLKRLHNDSTSIAFCGQYRDARSVAKSGQRAPAITYGYSKDHRPDLKQLLFILTTDADGGVPVQFRTADGNTNDSITHIETWTTLRSVAPAERLFEVSSRRASLDPNLSQIPRRSSREGRRVDPFARLQLGPITPRRDWNGGATTCFRKTHIRNAESSRNFGYRQLPDELVQIFSCHVVHTPGCWDIRRTLIVGQQRRILKFCCWLTPIQ